MTNSDPAAPAEFVGELADLIDVEMVVVGADIQMDIDVHVILPRELEDPIDLPRAVAVIAGSAANRRGAAIKRCHQVGVAFGYARSALLQGHT
jgi:hypothetical protein